MFAGSCIGVILLVMSLELLRRLGKEYDRYILRQHQRVRCSSPPLAPKNSSDKIPQAVTPPPADSQQFKQGANENGVTTVLGARSNTFRPNVIQQAVRATLHMMQFGVAYFIMLLAMYYNGFIIICIVIGAWLGSFVFSWENVSIG